MRTVAAHATLCGLCVLAALSGAGASAPVEATAGPALVVSPAGGLSRGSVVTVRATGLPPSTAVRVAQCGDPADRSVGSCPGVRGPVAGTPAPTSTSSRAGVAALEVALADPVFRSQPAGDDAPVHCRADVCRLHLTWTHTDGSQRTLVSAPLEFTGSPATVQLDRARVLPARSGVTVTGTAPGAEGLPVRVVEQACYDLVQGRGCYGRLSSRLGRVGADGRFRVRYPAQRWLADAPRTDCARPGLLGRCVISVVVLDGTGWPDDSFGVAAWGEPAAPLHFAVSQSDGSRSSTPSLWSRTPRRVVRVSCVPGVTPGLLPASHGPEDPGGPAATAGDALPDGPCHGRLEAVRLDQPGFGYRTGGRARFSFR